MRGLECRVSELEPSIGASWNADSGEELGAWDCQRREGVTGACGLALRAKSRCVEEVGEVGVEEVGEKEDLVFRVGDGGGREVPEADMMRWTPELGEHVKEEER